MASSIESSLKRPREGSLELPQDEKDDLIDRQPISASKEVNKIVKKKEKNKKSKLDDDPQFHEEQTILDPKYNETDYYYDSYLQKVYPYFYVYKARCKGRWIGRKLTEIMNSEFRLMREETLEEKIKTGQIRINGNIVDTDYVFKSQDQLTSRVHRHELPILAAEIPIIYQDDDLLVVNKPPSLPVHPCGRYRFNTCLAMLYKQYGFTNLHVIHRLDRLTSGVLMFGKNHSTAVKFSRAIVDRTVEKNYLCRVVGNFPDGEVTVDQPLHILCKKVGISIVKSTGKPSLTVFKKLGYNGKSSLVMCSPKTGRTHQIRVHLQYLGYPIVNDPFYNSFAFGSKKGKEGDYDGLSEEQLITALRQEHQIECYISEDRNGPLVDQRVIDISQKEMSIAFLGPSFQAKKGHFDSSKVTVDSGCEECRINYIDPQPSSLMLFLHAYSYSGDGFFYQTELPFWAQTGFDSL